LHRVKFLYQEDILKKILLLFIFVLLSGCGNTTVSTGPSVGLGPIKIGLRLNSKGEFILDGKASIPIILDEDLGAGLNWDITFSTVLNKMAGKSNYLVILWQDENGDIREQDFLIGQPFDITFEHDQWVRRISRAGDGNIVVNVEKQLMASIDSSPSSSAGMPVTNPTLPNPESFIRQYYQMITNGNYQQAWNMLSDHFKKTYNSSGYQPYADWWSTVSKIGVLSVTINSQDSNSAHLEAELSYTYTNGQVDTYDLMGYYLVFDTSSENWLIDDAKLISGTK
jgi:hypothetical protein